MSGKDSGENGASDVPAVGYGRPPVQHQFKKGQSGNPGGRPKGAGNKPKQYDPAAQPTARMILDEAYRPVTIREGDKVIELPAIQAVMRAMGVSAMKGNRLAQKTLAEIVQRVEAREEEQQLKGFENAFEYKLQWDREIERCKKLGLPDPEPLPHPDDIILDMRSGKVRTEGPLSKEEKAEWDRRLARRADAQAEVSEFARQYRRARDPEKKQQWLDEWHFEQRIYDIINDALPERYKAKLHDRSYREGASREGQALKEFLGRRSRKRRRANDNEEHA